jgi:lipopolysaccharide/colanic/teichoic acid biosynthesis glycosyltransferase
VRSSGGRTKRVLDLFAGSIAFAVSIPIIVAATLATRLSGDSGPVFYRAVRVGEGGATFAMMKLRTMVSAPGGPGVTRAQDPRVTSMGRILRRLKIDELPQLWNVVRGQMSLVGPRPEDERYIDWDDPLHRKVFTAKPGITGLSQLTFPFEERLLAGPDPERTYREDILPSKLMIDSYYLDHRSLALDLRILVWTVRSIFGPGGSPEDLSQRVRSMASVTERGRSVAGRRAARTGYLDD